MNLWDVIRRNMKYTKIKAGADILLFLESIFITRFYLFGSYTFDIHNSKFQKHSNLALPQRSIYID